MVLVPQLGQYELGLAVQGCDTHLSVHTVYEPSDEAPEFNNR